MKTNKQKLSQLIESVVKEELKKVLIKEETFKISLNKPNNSGYQEIDFRDLADIYHFDSTIKVNYKIEIKESDNIINDLMVSLRRRYHFINEWNVLYMSISNEDYKRYQDSLNQTDINESNETPQDDLSSQLEDDFLSLISNLNEEYGSEMDYEDIAEDIKIIKEPKQILNFISKHIKGSYELIKSYMSKGMSVALIASILGVTIQSCAVSGGCKQRGSFSNFQKSKPGKKMSNKRHTRPQGW